MATVRVCNLCCVYLEIHVSRRLYICQRLKSPVRGSVDAMCSSSRYTQHKLQTLTVAMGDIDFFKHVNDTYGHDAGDEVLRTLSRLFCTVIGEKGEVCRWGGEEFLFVFPGMDMEEVQLLMSDLLDDIRHTPVLYERKLIHEP